MLSPRAAVLVISLFVVAGVGWLASSCPAVKRGASPQGAATRAEGLAAWQQVYSVLSHPRCINCHTASNHPDQGDDRHTHLFHVVRGRSGFGVAGLNCSTCHQRANADSTGVPGAAGWHLAPLSMAWQDAGDKIFDSSALCRSVTDRMKNGNLDGRALLKHHTNEALVLWAFQPGRSADGRPRTAPPMTHAQFVDATRRWVDAGSPCP